MLRRMAELAMVVAEHVALQSINAIPEPAGTDRKPDPGLIFARVTRAAREATIREASIAADDLPRPRQPGQDGDRPARRDPRQVELRRLLH